MTKRSKTVQTLTKIHFRVIGRPCISCEVEGCHNPIIMAETMEGKRVLFRVTNHVQGKSEAAANGLRLVESQDPQIAAFVRIQLGLQDFDRMLGEIR